SASVGWLEASTATRVARKPPRMRLDVFKQRTTSLAAVPGRSARHIRFTAWLNSPLRFGVNVEHFQKKNDYLDKPLLGVEPIGRVAGFVDENGRVDKQKTR